jgi:hypothetical protein
MSSFLPYRDRQTVSEVRIGFRLPRQSKQAGKARVAANAASGAALHGKALATKLTR